MSTLIFGASKLEFHLEPVERLYTAAEGPDFEDLFKSNFPSLHAYAFTILQDPDLAEEVVQQVFFKVWEKQFHLSAHSSIKAYLYKAVYHESLNTLKHRRVKEKHALHVVRSNTGVNEASTESRLLSRELGAHIHEAVQKLPSGCRTVFQLSRFEGLKYQEIAAELGISVKTVESQMGKALRLLRERLIEFLPLLFFIILRSE